MGKTLLVSVPAVLAIFGLMSLTSGAKQDVPAERSKAMEVEGFGISVTTDKATYAAGDTIALKLSVFNYTGEEVTLHFTSAKRYDFTIEDEEGKEAWRWSRGRMFAQMLGEETLRPGKERLSYTVKYEGTLSPGTYKITGFLVARNRPMSVSLTAEVR